MAENKFDTLYPFESHWFQQSGLRQHYLDEGTGQPVVMLHGNPTWSFFYRDVVKALRGDYRCLVPDHMGCGYSDKPQAYAYTLKTHIDNLERLLDNAGITEKNPASLIVHDWGGSIGMGYAIRHPKRIRKIVILNTAAFFVGTMPLRIRMCRIPILGALAVRGLNAFARGATLMGVATPLPKDVAAGFLKPYHSWETRIATLRFVEDIPLHNDVPSYPVLKEIDEKMSCLADKPMLIQWGEQDVCFTMTFYDEWKRRFPNAESDVYADASHYLLEDRGGDIIPRIQGFLAQ